MGLFDKLFTLKNNTTEKKHLPIFGRYSDNNKTAAQQEAWRLAKECYDQKKYSESIVHFFTYLRDNELDNVVFDEDADCACFAIYQGSKKITGVIDNNCVRASVAIAKFNKRSIPAMRQLLEENFDLYYSKFYLKEDLLKLKIYNNIVDAAPYKLYYALKELYIQADKLDDILVNDFSVLEAAGIDHIIPCSQKEKKVKYDFFRHWTDKTIERIEALNADIFSVGISYMILNLIYKLDYLLLPEGRLTEKLEEINSIFWNMIQESTPIERNAVMMGKLKELQQWDYEETEKYFYTTKHTFSLTKPTHYKNVIEAIHNTLKNVVWYRENGHDDIVMEMVEYAIAYSQFSFSLPKPTTQLFDVMMHVNHNDYYQEMGYTDCYYDKQTGQFDQEAIAKKIASINDENRDRYPLININPEAFDYTNLQSFGLTMLMEITKLDFRKEKYATS